MPLIPICAVWCNVDTEAKAVEPVAAQMTTPQRVVRGPNAQGRFALFRVIYYRNIMRRRAGYFLSRPWVLSCVAKFEESECGVLAAEGDVDPFAHLDCSAEKVSSDGFVCSSVSMVQLSGSLIACSEIGTMLLPDCVVLMALAVLPKRRSRRDALLVVKCQPLPDLEPRFYMETSCELFTV